jgi:hypothetical protein
MMSERHQVGNRQYAVIELELSMVMIDGGMDTHPETTPVGPFDTREQANAWASKKVTAAGGGSWMVGPLKSPHDFRVDDPHTYDKDGNLTGCPPSCSMRQIGAT